MSSVRTIEDSLRNPMPGEPPWGLALLFPEQGGWSEEEYLALDTNHLVEFVDGCLEFPPMPTQTHQWIAGHLYRFLFSAIADHGLGKVWHAPYRVQAPDRFREPDVVCILNRNLDKAGERYTEAADLVVEVASEADPDRDWVTKKAEYAAAGIPEYWIAD
ncbi:MAG TPA: Uma2 family endonuclease, partial [Planctomycetaceae bacterium]